MNLTAKPSARFFVASAVLCLAVTVTAVSALAKGGSTTRDHRGPNGAPQGGVTVTPGPKPKTAPDVTPRTQTSTNGGVTTRDHRTSPSKVKDPNASTGPGKR